MARLLFVLVLLIIPGSQLLIYPVLWILMPNERDRPDAGPHDACPHHDLGAGWSGHGATRTLIVAGQLEADIPGSLSWPARSDRSGAHNRYWPMFPVPDRPADLLHDFPATR